MDRNNLIVLETAPCCWDETQTDALLLHRGNRASPFIIAHEFDQRTFSWSSGSYYGELLPALLSLKGLADPAWSISGCTPDDVLERYGEDWLISREDAEGFAASVNERIGQRDDLFTEEIWEEVRDNCVERGRATRDDLDEFERRVEREKERACGSTQSSVVAGTMYLDCNGYDYETSREPDRRGKPGVFVTLNYSTELVEEELAKEGIPLTQPNIAYMSDKIAQAIRFDAQENAAYVVSDTCVYWKSSVPDKPTQAESPSERASKAVSVANAASEPRGRETPRHDEAFDGKTHRKM